MRTGVLIAATVVLGVANAASAYTLDQVVIESWAGTGENEVLAVVDFWPGLDTDDSFAFGYRFETETISGLDLLQGLHDADNGFTFAESAGFVTDMWYDADGESYHTGYSWPDSWWSYWLSDDYGETWTASLVGAGDRVLTPGDTDGWLAKPGDDLVSVPQTPVPEAASLALLLSGATAIRRRR